MTRLVIHGPSGPTLLALVDPDAMGETEFEYRVVQALTAAYPEYRCIVFGGGFRYDDRLHRPDLALVAADYSHWFVVEVELVSHSFETHVLPQVKAFRYGIPQEDCAPILARELCLEPTQAATLVKYVPHGVAVIANRWDTSWEAHLRAHSVHLLAVSAFIDGGGASALSVAGQLEIVQENLGFGVYSATDRSLRFSISTKLAAGPVMLSDFDGTPSTWHVARGIEGVWVTKEAGLPDIPNGAYVQLVRTVGGRLALRKP